MKHSTSMRLKITVGLDIGDTYVHMCFLDETGAIIEEGRLRTTPTALRKRFGSLEPVRIALEVGTHSPWVSRLLEECGHDVFVANPRKLRLIYENDKKNDQVDAQWLARVARLDPKLLAPIQHRTLGTHKDLALLRARDALVAARTQLINHVRGAVKSFGARLPKGSSSGFPKKVAADIPRELRPALSPLLSTIGSITVKIQRYDQRIKVLCERTYPQTSLLRQVPGVGPVTALTYILTLEDPHRFKNSRAVGCYLGLTRRQSSSGQHDPELRITKAGDQSLRCLLVQCGQYILGPFGPDTDLRRWGLSLAQRGRKNAKKRAIVAVARKLTVLLHRLWITAEVYEPIRASTRRQTHKAISA